MLDFGNILTMNFEEVADLNKIMGGIIYESAKVFIKVRPDIRCYEDCEDGDDKEIVGYILSYDDVNVLYIDAKNGKIKTLLLSRNDEKLLAIKGIRLSEKKVSYYEISSESEHAEEYKEEKEKYTHQCGECGNINTEDFNKCPNCGYDN